MPRGVSSTTVLPTAAPQHELTERTEQGARAAGEHAHELDGEAEQNAAELSAVVGGAAAAVAAAAVAAAAAAGAVACDDVVDVAVCDDELVDGGGSGLAPHYVPASQAHVQAQAHLPLQQRTTMSALVHAVQQPQPLGRSPIMSPGVLADELNALGMHDESHSASNGNNTTMQDSMMSSDAACVSSPAAPSPLDGVSTPDLCGGPRALDFVTPRGDDVARPAAVWNERLQRSLAAANPTAAAIASSAVLSVAQNATGVAILSPPAPLALAVAEAPAQPSTPTGIVARAGHVRVPSGGVDASAFSPVGSAAGHTHVRRGSGSSASSLPAAAAASAVSSASSALPASRGEARPAAPAASPLSRPNVSAIHAPALAGQVLPVPASGVSAAPYAPAHGGAAGAIPGRLVARSVSLMSAPVAMHQVPDHAHTVHGRVRGADGERTASAPESATHEVEMRDARALEGERAAEHPRERGDELLRLPPLAAQRKRASPTSHSDAALLLSNRVCRTCVSSTSPACASAAMQDVTCLEHGSHAAGCHCAVDAAAGGASVTRFAEPHMTRATSAYLHTQSADAAAMQIALRAHKRVAGESRDALGGASGEVGGSAVRAHPHEVQTQRTPMRPVLMTSLDGESVCAAVAGACGDGHDGGVCDASSSMRSPLEHHSHADSPVPKLTVLPYPAFRELRSIDADVLAELLSGEHADKFDHVVVIDCRFPFEFDGGHIAGARNVFDEGNLLQLLFEKGPAGTAFPRGDRVCLVLHCEFSSQRGPRMVYAVRNRDRQANLLNYPSLDFPELYLLDKGYKEFYGKHKGWCTPQDYVPMRAPEMAFELARYMSSHGMPQAHGRRTAVSRSRSILTAPSPQQQLCAPVSAARRVVHDLVDDGGVSSAVAAAAGASEAVHALRGSAGSAGAAASAGAGASEADTGDADAMDVDVDGMGPLSLAQAWGAAAAAGSRDGADTDVVSEGADAVPTDDSDEDSVVGGAARRTTRTAASRARPSSSQRSIFSP